MRSRKRCHRSQWGVLLVLVCAALAACGQAPEPSELEASSTPDAIEAAATLEPEAEGVVEQEGEGPGESERDSVVFSLNSSAFKDGEPIPARFACDGEDISPVLEWKGAPQETVSFALILDDPDAPGGSWVHWVLFNIPASADGLDEAVPSAAILPDGTQHGANSWGRNDYGGPCPPGGTHRYFFKLYALDTFVETVAGSSVEALMTAMEDHILVEATLMGTYSR